MRLYISADEKYIKFILHNQHIFQICNISKINDFQFSYLVYFEWLFMLVILTHSYLETCIRVKGNSADPDQTPHNVASDQGLHCL